MSKKEVQETIDIETAGQAVEVHTLGAETVSVHIRGDAAADYELDVRGRDTGWLQNAGDSYTGSSDYDDVVTTGAPRVRIRCSNGTGTADDSATITLLAGGG